MIYLSAPIFMLDGLTIFRDDADPLQFYYYPTQPKLATNPDGTPSFLFVKFAAGDTPPPPGLEVGGGFLNFDADLKIDDNVLDDARRKVKQQMGLEQDVRLVPLLYRNGTTRLIFLDATPQPPPAPLVTPPRPATPVSPPPASPAAPGAVPPAAGAAIPGAAVPGAAAPGAPAAAPPPASPAAPVAATPAAPAAPAPPANMFRFVENANYSSTPSLIGDNRTAFSIELSQYGAQLVEQCLDAATFLAGVVYDLTFVALRPAFSVELHMDWDRVYDFVENHFTASAQIYFVHLQTDIDDVVEKLIEQRAIEFKVVSYAAGAADEDIVKQKDAAVDTVKKMITDTFFTPSMTPTPPGAAPAGAGVANTVKEATSAVSLGYTYKHINRQDVKKLSVNFAEADAMEVRIVPQGHLAGLMDALKEYDRSKFVLSVKFDDPFFQRYSVTVAATNAVATDHIDNIQVNLRYGGHPPRSVLLTAETPTATVEWALDPALGWNVQYDAQISFRTDAAAGAASSLQLGPFTKVGNRVEINPRDHYAILPIEIDAIAIPWDRYSQIEVDLEYADAAHGLDLRQTFLLANNKTSASWTVRLSDPGLTSYRYKTTFYTVSGGAIAGDWQTVEQPLLAIKDPFSDTLKVTIIPAVDFTKVARLIVTMNYNDPANNIDQTDVIALKSLDDMNVWSVRIMNGKKRDYTYAVTTQYKDGTVDVLPPLPASGASLAITGKYKRQMDVVVSAAGKSFREANLSHVDVTLTYDDPAHGQHAQKVITLRSTDDVATFSFTVVDPDKADFTFEVLRAGADGFSQRQEAQSSAELHLVIPI
jgi:hypothetical protein